MRNAIAVILGGGRGERLRPLTARRAKPAVPFAGMYRLVDVPISNCLHAGIERIYVLTQYRSASLNRHVAQTYRFDAFSNGIVEVLAAEQSEHHRDESGWYTGTADAVRKQLHHFGGEPEADVIILSGDQVYMLDIDDVLRQHRSNEADVTIAATWVTREDAKRFGVMKVDKKRQITQFAEKPQEEDVIQSFEVPDAQGNNTHLASMGIYVFKWRVLSELMQTDERDDFGKHILPATLGKRRLFAYPFSGFWEDVGTIKSYHDVNLALTDPVPSFDLFQANTPLFTRPRFLPPAKLGDAVVQRALVSNGAIIGDGATVRRSVIGIRTVVGPRCVLDGVVVNGAGDYDFNRPQSQVRGEVPLGIGDGSVLRDVIVDRDVRIGERVQLINERGVDTYQDDYIHVRDGIIVVPSRTTIPDGYRF